MIGAGAHLREQRVALAQMSYFPPSRESVADNPRQVGASGKFVSHTKR